MSNDHEPRFALFARITRPVYGKSPEEASLFYGEVFKTTQKAFWYHGPYSKQSADKANHKVRFFPSQKAALVELEKLQKAAGLEEKQIAQRRSQEATKAFYINQAKAVAGWTEGAEA